ncbi:hypothetical protein C0995_007680 [Termitomyces sp. Mi166|nr:hypothetical protein C0995_007680 [Termitomyces sp. Mi166\
MSTSESTKPPSPTQQHVDQTPTPAIASSHSQAVSTNSETPMNAPSPSATPNLSSNDQTHAQGATPTPNSNDQTHAHTREQCVVMLKPYVSLSSFLERIQTRMGIEVDEQVEYEAIGYSFFVAHLTLEQAREMLLDGDVEVVSRNAEAHLD